VWAERTGVECYTCWCITWPADFKSLTDFLLQVHLPRRTTRISSSLWGWFLGHEPKCSLPNQILWYPSGNSPQIFLSPAALAALLYDLLHHNTWRQLVVMHILLINVKKFSVFCRRSGLQECVFDVELDFEFSDICIGWRNIWNYIWKCGWTVWLCDWLAACWMLRRSECVRIYWWKVGDKGGRMCRDYWKWRKFE